VIGNVYEAGRALLQLSVMSSLDTETNELVVWVDTAFDGELVVDRSTIDKLNLPNSATVEATLADGTSVLLESFSCLLQWFGEWREVEVIANDGKLPLLGVGLLRGRKLTVDYRSNELDLE
jgi:clan AA aspartic protease